MSHPFRCPFSASARIGRTLFIPLVGIGLLAYSNFTFAAAPGCPPEASDELVEPTEEDEMLDEEEELEDIELLDLEVPMVVTASRHAQKITSVPHAMSVVTAEDIRQSGARSIPDALRLVPGVDVADLSFNNSAVSIRGFHGFLSRQVLVLVDGRQIFDSHFGGTLWGIWPFQLEDIERIEVVRGPGGVTWGANAVNGAINIITKDPRDQLGLTYTAGGGSRGTYKTHLGYAFEEDKLRMRISGEYEASDGYIRGGSILRRLDDEAKTGRMNLHAIYEAGPDDTWTFSAGSGIGDGGFAPTPLAGFGLRRNSASQSSFLLAKWRHQVAKDNAFELTGYVNDSFGSPGVPAIDYRYQQLALQFGHTFKRNDTHTVSWGIDGRADLLDASNSDPFMLSKGFVSTGIIGLYLRDEWRFAPKWALDLGGRIDYEFYGGFQPSARAALSYELSEDSMIYGAVSRAFQMSPAGLRFLRLPMLNGIVTATGNRNVAAETLIAYELGYRGRIADRLDLNLNLFWHELDDLTTISPRLGPPGLIRMAFGNHAEASMYGAEFDAKYRATDNLTLLANYTFQELDWRADVPLQDKDTISPPEHKAMVGARYSPSEDLHLSSHLYWVDFVKAPNPSLPFISNRIEPYFRLDVVAEQELWDDRASIAVGVRNLLDSGHFEGSTIFMNDAEVPRMVFAEFRLRLQ